jgi:hypothetical protein
MIEMKFDLKKMPLGEWRDGKEERRNRRSEREEREGGRGRGEDKRG